MAVTAPYATAAFTSNGTQDGVVTVSSATVFSVGAIVYIGGTALPTLTCQVIQWTSSTTLQVRLETNNVNQLNYGFADLRSYTTAASATITQPSQDLSGHDQAIVSYTISSTTGQTVPT